jgi:hypothetical protein
MHPEKLKKAIRTKIILTIGLALSMVLAWDFFHS